MKHALTTLALLATFNSAFGQLDQDSDIILALESAENADILKVYEAFRPDDPFRIVNSCEILGWVVFEAKQGQVATRSTTRAFVQQRLSEVEDLPEHTWIDDISKMEVAMQCRQAMQEALDPQGE